MIVSSDGVLRGHVDMRVEHEVFFAGMGRDRRPGRPRADRAIELGKSCRVGRRRRHVEFEIAGDAHATRAERQKAGRIIRILREAEIDGAEDGFRRAGNGAPALGGFAGDAGVGENQRRAARAHGRDDIGPKLRLGEDRDVGTPMIEEAFDEFRGVDRRILMERARRQARAENARRRDGAACHEHVESALNEAVDERQQRQAFAEARAVQPDKSSARSGAI